MNPTIDGLPPEVPAEALAPVLGQWWFIDAGENLFGDLEGLYGEEGDEEVPDDLIANVEYLGEDGGMAHYSGQYNVDTLFKVMEESGESISEEEKEITREILESMKMEIWINDDNIIARSAFDIDFTEPETGAVAVIHIDGTASDFGGTFDIALPEDAQLFDPFALLGAAGAF